MLDNALVCTRSLAPLAKAPTVVRRHSSKFRLNCALLVTILKFRTHRETIGENILSYRTTLTDMLFPWKLHLMSYM